MGLSVKIVIGYSGPYFTLYNLQELFNSSMRSFSAFTSASPNVNLPVSETEDILATIGAEIDEKRGEKFLT